MNARDLQAFLEVGARFASWITERIESAGFVEDEDYIVCFPISGSKECGVKGDGRGGHNAKEYSLTLDMAKELSMLERNAQGKRARRYFIACEKRLRSLSPASSLPDLADVADLASSFS